MAGGPGEVVDVGDEFCGLGGQEGPLVVLGERDARDLGCSESWRGAGDVIESVWVEPGPGGRAGDASALARADRADRRTATTAVSRRCMAAASSVRSDVSIVTVASCSYGLGPVQPWWRVLTDRVGGWCEGAGERHDLSGVLERVAESATIHRLSTSHPRASSRSRSCHSGVSSDRGRVIRRMSPYSRSDQKRTTRGVCGVLGSRCQVSIAFLNSPSMVSRSPSPSQ